MSSAPATRHRRRSRGVTLVEGMAAAAIFATGIIGIFSGIMVASRQNAVANRLAEASAIAQQVRAGVQIQGYSRLTASGGLLSSSRCSRSSDVLALSDGLGSLPNACAIDLDAYEDGANAESALVPGYPLDRRRAYRRVLVWQREPTMEGVESLMVVVSFGGTVSRRFVRQATSLYNPAVTQTGVEL
jgi:hypothetical protein